MLSALLDHPSEEAYLSIRKFAKRNDIAPDEAWFGVLSKRMVERAITFKAWNSDEIVTFFSYGELPIQTEKQFYDLIYSALVNIQTEFDSEDMTAKSVLLEAPNEDSVRDWLGAELQKRVGKNATFVKENHVLHKKGLT